MNKYLKYALVGGVAVLAGDWGGAKIADATKSTTESATTVTLYKVGVGAVTGAILAAVL